MHPIHKHMSSRRMARKADERYDAKQAYNKNLSGKARLHYLENDIADKGMSMKSPMDMGHMSAAKMKSPMDMGHKAPAKMKSAMDMKAPMKMGHEAPSMKAPMKKAKKMSPADMKAPMKKESVKQERKDLMKDNPVVKDASGKRKKLSLKDIKRGGKGRVYG